MCTEVDVNATRKSNDGHLGVGDLLDDWLERRKSYEDSNWIVIKTP
jgi:hypothetical protein